ncbi:hypothetical protein [Flavobacterium litorale]|uniref:Uncharacterized protein n=1 Tax=Flavobacterium litorale TaxID=2856519 RepID=A0ABX8V5Y6_9FLAO|nr:hypothetical protein [Flavobacterium litorale]QYJ68254.1 hypothetical protein K1I41_12120 [Flavobacterium litorale]
MHRNLIISAFQEVKAREKDKNGTTTSDTAAAKVLSDFIGENQKFPFGERSLTKYYKSALNQNEDELLINRSEVVQALCSYLGYDNFESFKEANKIRNSAGEYSPKKLNSTLTSLKSNKVLLIISSTICMAVILLILHFSNNERWMIWENDRYIEVSFDLEKYNLSQLKLYSEDRVDNLRKISVDCDTEFFDPTGKVKIWYGKNARKELEFFTSVGLHPGTGKTLKPITNYMINKYVCLDM